MARVMRVGIIVAIVLCTACGSALPTIESETPPLEPLCSVREVVSSHIEHRVKTHHENALALQASLNQQTTAELLEDAAYDRVLLLAREQNCLASYLRSPELGDATVSMLDEYAAFHERFGSEPSLTHQIRSNRASREAMAASQGVSTPYMLGCRHAIQIASRGLGAPRSVVPAQPGTTVHPDFPVRRKSCSESRQRGPASGRSAFSADRRSNP